MTDKPPPLPKPDLGSILVGREEISLGHSDEALRSYAEEAVKMERSACADEVASWRGGKLLLAAGEMTAQELRTVSAVTTAIAAALRSRSEVKG